MVKDDLWSDPTDEFGDAEISIEPVKQTADISANNASTTGSSKTVLKKVVLKRVVEPKVSTAYLSEQLEQNHSHATSENNISTLEPAYQNPLLPTSSTTSHEDKTKNRVDIADLLSSSRLPEILTPAPIILEDLWSDNSEQPIVTEALTLMEEPAALGSLAMTPDGETNKLTPIEEIAETGPDLELEDDLWTTSDDFEALDEDEELGGEWSDNEQIFIQEDNDAKASFTDPLLSYSESAPDLFAEFENESTLRGFEQAVESGSLLDGFEFIDIEAELAELEQVEAELAAQKPEVERVVGISSKRGRGQAAGWGGSNSVLYINWEDEEKAKQEALERLGYSKLKISEATRTFVIQAARACKLTLRQERLLTTQLANARSHLAQLPDHDDYEKKRDELKAEIAELERTLTSNLQWVAVKKAPHFLGQGIELDDLIQYGMLGVIAGIRHFDISRGTHIWIAINWWVFQAQARAVGEYGRLIRLPVYLHESLANIKKHRTELLMILGRLPTNEELADAVQMPVERLEELLSLPRTISLDSCIKAEHTNNGYSFQPAEESFVVGEEITNNDTEVNVKQEIDAMLDCLKPRERQVIESRYDLAHEHGEMRTLEEVGKKMCVTRERVRQIEERAFLKIRVKLGLQKKQMQQQVAVKRNK